MGIPATETEVTADVSVEPASDAPSYPEDQLESGVLFLEAFGPKRAPKVLEKELPSGRGYGYGRAMEAIRSQFEAVIKGPRTDADTLRERINALAMMRARKARDFDEAIEIAHEVVMCGAAARSLKERQSAVAALTTGALAPPAMPKWSDEAPLDNYARQTAVDEWYRLMDEWYRALQPAQQRAYGKEPWKLRDECRMSLDDAARQCVEWRLVAALSAFRNGGDASAFIADINCLEGLQAGVDVSAALLREPRSWQLLGQEIRCYPHRVAPEYLQCVPTQDALRGLSLTDLVTLRMKCREDFRPVIQAEVERALPLFEETQVYFENGVVFSAGAAQMYRVKDGPANSGAYPTEPAMDGWFILGQQRYRDELPEARWVPEDLAQLVMSLPTEQDGGTCLLSKEVVSAFSRHETHGYPRLNWTVSAGSNRRWFELPIQRGQNFEGPLVERIEALKDLLDAGLEAFVPAAAWWVDAFIGTTQRGAPRLAMGPTANVGTLIARTGWQQSRGRHAPEGSTIEAKKDHPFGARVLWSGFASSSGGGVSSSCLIAWIPEKGTLVLDTGVGLKFEDGVLVEVVGAGLDPADDPTR